MPSVHPLYPAVAFLASSVIGLAVSTSASADEAAVIRDLWEFGNRLDSAVGMKVTDAGQVFGDYQIGPSRRPMSSTEGAFVIPEGAVPEGIASLSPAGFRDLSADRMMVGYVVHEGVPQAYFVYWEAGGNAASLLEPLRSPPVASEANAVTPDKAYTVGYTEKWGEARAFRWTSAGGLQNLGALGAGGTSVAYGVSNDGSIVVGESRETVAGPRRAFRWTASGMQSLGTLGGDEEETVALAISGDGTTIVGASETPDFGSQAIVHTTTAGLVALPTIDDYPGESSALAVSADGSVIAGWSQSEEAPQGEACVWIEGAARSLTRMLEDDYGLDLERWELQEARCSPNGLRFTGRATHFGMPVPFMIRLGPGLEYPIIEGDAEFGGSYVVRAGETREFQITTTSPDGGNLARLWSQASSRMTWVTPPLPSVPASRTDILRCQPTAADYGKTYTILATVGHPSYSAASNIRFSIHVPPNEAPTALPISPVTLECVDGEHSALLATTVDDADGHDLTVTWKVDDQVVKQENVAPGTQVSYGADYPHGVHQVVLEVFDGYQTTTVGTTVTVQDTALPIIAVAADAVFPTDAGKDFASNVVLTPPDVSDASGHGFTLTSDAPEVYPLGQTIVTWTAEDEAGNAATATQKVTVEDREAPQVEGVASVRFFVDPGTLVSTQRPPLPQVSDNVDAPEEIAIESDPPEVFPLGATTVKFTATDAAGNAAEWTTEVVVVNRRPKANAGSNITVTTKSERGVRVSLDGSASSDPDEQKLKFAWSAPGVKLAGAKNATPSGLFPVGATFATLAVTDPAGEKSTDRVRVVVKLKNGKPRPRGAQANEAFAAASQQAASSSSVSASSGLLYANVAAAYGAAAGEFVRWEEGQSEADALLAYGELRALQQAYGGAATVSLLSAYAETGDEEVLQAAMRALNGSASAAADLFDP